MTELLKGVLEGCVLQLISREARYGYEITRQLNALGFPDIAEGTVYTILLRLERNQLVEVERRPSEKGPPRKLYTLNEKGRRELESFWRRWDFVSAKIQQIRETENV